MLDLLSHTVVNMECCICISGLLSNYLHTNIRSSRVFVFIFPITRTALNVFERLLVL